MNQEDKEKEVDLDYLNLAWDLEEEWLNSRRRYSDRELLEIFPEVKEIIPEKITEWQSEEKRQTEIIKQRLTEIRQCKDETERLVQREWLKIDEGEELLKIERHIARLKTLKSAAEGRVIKGRLSDEDIQRAKEVPIEDIVEIRLRRSGNKLFGLCPLHNERSPSFYIYQDSNSFYCYGCNVGGDIISFVKLSYGLSFPDAVRWLNGAQISFYDMGKNST